jgi:hypothetical protein
LAVLKGTYARLVIYTGIRTPPQQKLDRPLHMSAQIHVPEAKNQQVSKEAILADP